jgi:hypothetical protein
LDGLDCGGGSLEEVSCFEKGCCHFAGFSLLVFLSNSIISTVFCLRNN